MVPQRKQDAIEKYYDLIIRWKRQCKDRGMSDEDILKLYDETLERLFDAPLENPTRTRPKKFLAYLALGLAILLVVAGNYKAIHSCIACNLQDYIYPGLRLLRKLFIPVISMFPSLTALYHETCLIQNPYFAVADMDCWPCSSINIIREVYKPSPSEHYNAPFIYKTEQGVVHPVMLKDFYVSYKNVLDKEAPKILTNNKFYSHPTEMFHQLESGEKHTYNWKFNNMNAAKTLRQLISRPDIVPKFGQSTERYLIVDSSHKQFQIPDTECNFSFLIILSGLRTIELNPAEECTHQCKSIKIELDQTYLLWYNWWYWRPIVQPSTGNGTFIAHVGSYC